MIVKRKEPRKVIKIPAWLFISCAGTSAKSAYTCGRYPGTKRSKYDDAVVGKAVTVGSYRNTAYEMGFPYVTSVPDKKQ
jgi:hypothetical protein